MMYVMMIAAVFIQSALKLGLCRRYCSLSFGTFWEGALLPIMLLAVIMSAGAMLPSFLLEAGFMRLVLSCTCCWLLTALSMWKFFMTSEEKETFLNLIKKLV